MPDIVISYSHQDTVWLNKLKTMLKPVAQSKQLEVWDDNQIRPGSIWRDEIMQTFSSARVAVFLVSQHFLASDFIPQQELAPVLQSAESNGVRVLWLCLDQCLYEHSALAKFQSVHDPRKPLEDLPDPEQKRIFKKLCNTLREIFSESGKTLEVGKKSIKVKVKIEGTLELKLDCDLEDFDVVAFKRSLSYLLGPDVHKVEIAEIRSGSTIVELSGDRHVLNRFRALLKHFPGPSQCFVDQTKLRSFSWNGSGTQETPIRVPKKQMLLLKEPKKNLKPLSKIEIRQKVIEVVSRVIMEDPSDITVDSSFIDDLQMESLALLQTSIDLDYEFRLGLPVTMLLSLESIEDVVLLVSTSFAKSGLLKS